MSVQESFCRVSTCNVVIKKSKFTDHNENVHLLRKKHFCKECVRNGSIIIYQTSDFLTMEGHINLYHPGAKDCIGRFVYSLNQNPILFANKICSLIKLPYPISSLLNSALKGSIDDRIQNAYRNIEAIISLDLSEKSNLYVYFRFNKHVIHEAIENNDLSNSNLLTALRKGYVGKTVSKISREQKHAASKNSVYPISISIPNFLNLDQFIEGIIIKTINVHNLDNNEINGFSYFVNGLNNEDHVLVGIYFILKAFELMRIFIKDNHISGGLHSYLDLPASSSEASIYNYANNIEIEPVDLNDYEITSLSEIKNLELNQLINVYGFVAHKGQNDYGCSYRIEDSNGNHSIGIFLGNHKDNFYLKNLIEVNKSYLFINCQIIKPRSKPLRLDLGDVKVAVTSKENDYSEDEVEEENGGEIESEDDVDDLSDKMDVSKFLNNDYYEKYADYGDYCKILIKEKIEEIYDYFDGKYPISVVKEIIGVNPLADTTFIIEEFEKKQKRIANQAFDIVKIFISEQRRKREKILIQFEVAINSETSSKYLQEIKVKPRTLVRKNKVLNNGLSRNQLKKIARTPCKNHKFIQVDEMNKKDREITRKRGKSSSTKTIKRFRKGFQE